MSDWQDISTAPKDGTPVRLWAKLREYDFLPRIGRFNRIRSEWELLPTSEYGRGMRVFATHWMPATEPRPC